MGIIDCHNLSKSYRTGFFQKKSKPALNDLTFTVNQSEVFGIIGPNGAGKSTVIKSLMGFIRPDQGSAYLGSHKCGSRNSLTNVGYLPENPSLYKALSVVDHLHFAGRLAGMTKENLQKRIEELLHIVGLTDSATIPIKRFSKGMTQRAALAYALLLKPDILILDEPMSGLDPLGRNLVVSIIRDYHDQGNTILFCSHILSDVERICNRIGIMHNGELVSITSAAELMEKQPYLAPIKSPLEELFLSIVQTTKPQ